MVGHALVVALRGFRRRPLASAIGVLVLSLGLVCFGAAYLFVSHVRSYERHFPNADRTYVVMQRTEVPNSGVSIPFSPQSALPLADQLRLDAPELDAVARYAFGGRGYVTIDGEPSYRLIAFAEPEFLEIFDLTALAGDAVAAIATPGTAIITEETATSLFGTLDVVGRTLQLTAARTVDVAIGAVVAEVPHASHLSRTGIGSRGFELLASWDVFETAAKNPFYDSWGNTPVLTYALLPADGSLTAVELDRRLADLSANRIPEQFSWGRFAFDARPIAEIAARTLAMRARGFYDPDRPVDVLDALLIFAGAILGVACLNFVNLATAESASRARVVGTRKVMGATAGQIVREDLIRTALLAAAALVLALAALVPAARLLDGAWARAVQVPWTELRLWGFVAVAWPALALAAGLYPAVALARIRPSAALRPGGGRGGSATLRALLVGVQFAAASFLFAIVVVVLAQRDLLRETLLERFDDPYVVLNPLSPVVPGGVGHDPDLVAAELARSAAIRGVAAVGQFPFQQSFAGNRFQRVRGEDAPSVVLADVRVAHDYFAVMEVPLLAGRVFSREHSDDAMPGTEAEVRERRSSPRVVLDRAAVEALGWADPAAAVGESIFFSGGGGGMEVIGVVDSVPSALTVGETAGTLYFFHPQFAQFNIVRLDRERVQEGLEHIDATLKVLLPDRPPVRRIFMDEAFESAHFMFTLMNRVFTGLALFALAIASAGLYGMAGFVTSRRTREIGVRKTQGASAARILRLLLWEFSKPVLIANVLVAPFVLLAASRYLQLFAVRESLTALPSAVALGGTLAIAWLAVGSHVLRAANVRPTEALRHE